MSSEKQDTLQHAIDEYLKKGFGTMNKNDFEVFIFNHLLSNSLNGKSDNAISRELRIPESKVKRLRYEASLSYQQDSEDVFKQRFYDILKNRVYKTTENDCKIQFSIKDKSLRLYLEDMLEGLGSFADSSFNSNVVTITANDFMLLLAKFEDKDDIVEIIKKSIKDNKEELPENTDEIVIEGLTAMIKDIGDKVAPKVTEFVLKQIQKI